MKRKPRYVIHAPLSDEEKRMLRTIVGWMTADPTANPPRFSMQQGVRYAIRKLHENPPAHVGVRQG